MTVALVSGASRGLGRAAAIELARQASELCLIGRNEAALDDARQACVTAGAPSVSVVSADLGVPDAPAEAVRACLERHRRIDQLVNCAGDTKRGAFTCLSDDDHLSGFNVKYHAMVRMCRAAWPALEKTRGGIVNVSGIGAYMADESFTIGGPVNAAVINFSRSLAKKGMTAGVNVNVVCPGHIRTGRLTRRIAELARSRNIDVDAAERELRDRLGIVRFGSADEVADLIGFLLSDRAVYIQGAVMTIDGGATLLGT